MFLKSPEIKQHKHLEGVSLLMCFLNITINQFQFILITPAPPSLIGLIFITFFLSPAPTIKQAVTRSKLLGCIVRQSHTEILSQEKEIENVKRDFIKERCTPQITLWKIKAMIATSTIQAYKDDTEIKREGASRVVLVCVVL